MYDEDDNDYYEDDAYDHYMHTGEPSEWFEDEHKECYEYDDYRHKDLDEHIKANNNAGCLGTALCIIICISLTITALYIFP